MLSETMTQLLLLMTVLGGVGTLIAYALSAPARFSRDLDKTASELGNKITLLTLAIENLTGTVSRLERENNELEVRVRHLELGKVAQR